MAALLLTFLVPEADSLERWVEALGDDDIEVRESASAALRSAGERAAAHLREALKSGDSEVRARAGDLLAGLAAARATVAVFSLRNADPAQTAEILRAAFRGVAGFEVIHDLRTRSVVVRSADAVHGSAIRTIITELDSEPPGVVFVVASCTPADQIARRLEKLLRGEPAGEARDQRVSGQADLPSPDSGCRIIRTSPSRRD